MSVGEVVTDALAGGHDTPAPERAILRRLAVRDFRNLARVDVELPAEGIAVVGENGHGKSNLLEAIYYLEVFRSARGALDRDLVRFGAPGFHVSAGVTTDRSHTVAVGFDRQSRRKKVAVDGSEVSRLSDALGAVPAVMLSPRDTAMVAGAPSERRRFLDVMLAVTSRRYLAALQQYRGALVRRNAALRDAARGGDIGGRVSVWDPALAEHGAVLWTERVAWVERAADEFASQCAAIGERGEARMRYASALHARIASDRTVESARVAIERQLDEQRGLDIRRGLTHAGPHRDDLDLQLEGRPLRQFGSAGQQRTAAIALRLLEGATLRERGGYMPLALLDDPFAELDARRAARILDLLGRSGMGQTVLVVPREEDIPRELTALARYRIESGGLAADV